MAFDGGNEGGRQRDNHFMHASAELMDVVRDLCRLAAAFLLIGDVAWAETLVDQCSELLAHRARLVADSHRNDAGDGGNRADGHRPRSLRGRQWMN
jgi:hypothetical protein